MGWYRWASELVDIETLVCISIDKGVGCVSPLLVLSLASTLIISFAQSSVAHLALVVGIEEHFTLISGLTSMTS